MNTEPYVVILYVLFWAVRIRGCFRRWPQPLLRGPEWFFNVHVPPGFYEGEGKKLLHQYRMRMFIPFALDVPLALAIFLSGNLAYLSWLVLGLCVVIHINHSYSVDRAERQARAFAIPETEQPVAAVLLSLTPRRLRDYSNPVVEWVLGLSTLAAMAWLVRYYFAAPEHHNLRLVFGTPVLMLYVQAGLLFVKHLVVSWRSPLPQSQTAEHMAAREETRKYFLRVCDLNRVAAVAMIVFWPFAMNLGPAAFDRVYSIWFAIWLAISVVIGVWIEIKRKQIVALELRARPVKLPDLLHQSELARWPVCYQPSVPMLLLKGARGYSLNLANALAPLGAAYLAGLVLLFVWLPKGH